MTFCLRWHILRIDKKNIKVLSEEYMIYYKLVRKDKKNYDMTYYHVS